ncbi:MAG: metallophosphoesterase family protein [Candidatus Binatia bacterium]
MTAVNIELRRHRNQAKSTIVRSIHYAPISLATSWIGVISDTHGLVRPEALAALKNSELIIHAGDIGNPEVLSALEQIAPVLAIKGNNDRDSWARKFPDVFSVDINTITIRVIHNVNELMAKPPFEQFRVVISGHSHKPSVARRQGVLFVNPGSAGPRRFKLPVSVARLKIRQGKAQARIIELPI